MTMEQNQNWLPEWVSWATRDAQRSLTAPFTASNTVKPNPVKSAFVNLSIVKL